MRFSRQEYWSELPCPPPGDFPNPGIEPVSPTLQAASLPLSHWEAQMHQVHDNLDLEEMRPERLSDLPSVTQLANTVMKIQTKFACSKSHTLSCSQHGFWAVSWENECIFSHLIKLSNSYSSFKTQLLGALLHEASRNLSQVLQHVLLLYPDCVGLGPASTNSRLTVPFQQISKKAKGSSESTVFQLQVMTPKWIVMKSMWMSLKFSFMGFSW